MADNLYQDDDETELVSMEELMELQAMLQEAQSSETRNKLSQRNCIQIVMKLKEMKMIDLLYTIDGKEYITPEHLEKEIADEVYAQGGRINMVELQQILNIDLVHIEAAVERLLKYDKSIIILQGELIHTMALDDMAGEVNEVLQEMGKVDTSEVCQRFGLPTEFIMQELKSRIGTVIKGKLSSDGSIYTEGYERRQVARLRGFLSSLTRSCTMAELARNVGVTNKLAEDTTKSLIESKHLDATLYGKGESSTFIPQIETATQQTWIEDFYSKNNYIDYDSVVRLGIRNAKSYLKSKYPNSVSLSSCIASSALVEQLEDSVEGAIETASFIIGQDQLPSSFTDEDVEAIVHSLKVFESSGKGKSKSQPKAEIFEGVIVSQTLLEKIKGTIQALLPDLARNASAHIKTKLKSEPPAPSETSGKRGKKASRQASRQASENQPDDDDDDWSTGSKKKKKGKRRQSSNKPSDQSKEASSSSVTATQLSDFLSTEKMQEVVLEKLPELEEIEYIIAAIIDSFLRDLEKEFENLVQTVFTLAESSSHKENFSKLQGLYLTVANNMHIFQKGYEEFEDEQLKKDLAKHLLRTLGAQAVDVVIKASALEQHIDCEVDGDLTNAMRREILSAVDPDIRKELNKLLEQTKGEDLSQFLEDLHEFASKAQLYYKSPSSREERELKEHMKDALLQQLKQSTELSIAVHLTCCLLCQIEFGWPVHAPGRCIPKLLSALRDQLDEEVSSTLERARQLAVAQLKNKADEESSESIDNEDQSTIAELVRIVEAK